MRLVVPNLPPESFAPVSEEIEQGAGVQQAVSFQTAGPAAGVTTSSTQRGGEGLAVVSINCQAGSAGSLQVLAGA